MSKLATLRMYLRKPKKLDHQTDLYAHTVELLDGGELDLSSFRGHPTLIVNIASKCGFTPQYEGLQSLYDHYHDRGLQILGSPSGDFADQEFEDATEIGAFCRKNYGVQFPLTARTSVREHPDQLWSELISQPNSAPPKWNFTKYLVGADGHLIERWGSTVRPEDERIVAAIYAALEPSSAE
jgi:glutathione peroxidase